MPRAPPERPGDLGKKLQPIPLPGIVVRVRFLLAAARGAERNGGGRSDPPSMTGRQANLNPPRLACLLGCLGLLLWLPVSSAQAQRGAIVMPRNLSELVDQAATIVRGHVISARVEPHPELTGIYTVVVTLQVEEVLKGEAGATFTFRQFIWDIRDRYDAAGYRKGQHLLLLMNAPTQYGLSSPCGLDQGRFRILRDPQGHEFAVNGHANAGLFKDMAPELAKKGVQLTPALSTLVTEHRKGPIMLKDLEDIVRAMAGAE